MNQTVIVLLLIFSVIGSFALFRVFNTLKKWDKADPADFDKWPWTRGQPTRLMTYGLAGLCLTGALISGQQLIRAVSCQSWPTTQALVDGVDKENWHETGFGQSYHNTVYLVRYHFLVGDTKYDGKNRLYVDDYQPDWKTNIPLTREDAARVNHFAFDSREKAVNDFRHGHFTIYFNPGNPNESVIIRHEPNWIFVSCCLLVGCWLLFTAYTWKGKGLKAKVGS